MCVQEIWFTTKNRPLCKERRLYYHLILFSVLMGKQVILAIFVIPPTLGTETKFQVFPIRFRPSADGTTMMGTFYSGNPDFLRICLATADIFRRKCTAAGSQKENNKIQKGNQRFHAVGRCRQYAKLQKRHPGRRIYRH